MPRQLVFYKDYFRAFYDNLPDRAKTKLDHALFILGTQPIVPQVFVKHLSGSSGIYELRASVGSNEYRTLFFFENGSLIEGGKVVVIGNGFIKKDNRDYTRALELAERIRAEYFVEQGNTDPETPKQP